MGKVKTMATSFFFSFFFFCGDFSFHFFLSGCVMNETLNKNLPKNLLLRKSAVTKDY